MDLHRMMDRAAGVLLVAALATALLAPAAEAGRRDRHHRASRHVPVIVARHSDAGAVFGFLGGLVLGTVIANAQPAPPPDEPDYDYFDPYCREFFGSLIRYEDHLDRHHHPAVAEVLDARSGRCVDTARWRDGRWIGDDDEVVGACGRERSDAPADEEWED